MNGVSELALAVAGVLIAWPDHRLAAALLARHDSAPRQLRNPRLLRPSPEHRLDRA